MGRARRTIVAGSRQDELRCAGGNPSETERAEASSNGTTRDTIHRRIICLSLHPVVISFDGLSIDDVDIASENYFDFASILSETGPGDEEVPVPRTNRAP